MKRSWSSSEHRLHNFWGLFFAACEETLLQRLATLDGLFRIEQRLIVPRIELADGSCTFAPNYVFHRSKDVRKCVYRIPSRMPVCLEFSGIAPAHHVDKHPVYPIKDAELPSGQSDKPRQMDRDYARYKVASWLGELVLDVDLDEADYDRRNVCACVGKRQCCDTCWRVFMTPAIEVILYLLEHVFHWRAFFFVYSGRRGFHVWVLDRTAVMMTSEQRAAFIERVNTLHAGPNAGPARHVYEHILRPHFENMPALMERFQEPALRSERDRAYRECVMQALYPKFDTAVTSDATHNHKMPLMLHPSTGKLCITMQRGEETAFRPSQHLYDRTQVTLNLLKHALLPIEAALDKMK